MEAHLKVHTSVKTHEQFFERHRKVALSIVIGALFTLILYVLQVNALAIKGFQIQDFEEGIARLEKENRALERDIAALQGSEVLTTKIATLGLTGAGPIEYIKADSTDSFAWVR